MTLASFILTAIFGPTDTRSLEEAEADYIAAKERYDACVARGDKRGQGDALKVLNPALNAVLRAHSDAARLHTQRARFSVRSRPARA